MGQGQIFVVLSESFYWKQAYFKVFDSASIERAIPPPSENKHASTTRPEREQQKFCAP